MADWLVIWLLDWLVTWGFLSFRSLNIYVLLNIEGEEKKEEIDFNLLCKLNGVKPMHIPGKAFFTSGKSVEICYEGFGGA